MATSTGAPPPNGGLLYFMAGDGAAVGFTVRTPVSALLHPLHHQSEQGGHRPVHIDTRHCTRLKVGNAERSERDVFCETYVYLE